MKDRVLPVVREGGDYAAYMFNRLRAGDEMVQVEEKGPSDFVTRVDREIEERVISVLERLLPGVSVVGEEEHCRWGGGSVPQNCWILDPLDGTRNFLRGYARFAISLALRLEGELAMGMVYQPVGGDLFWGCKGCGAWHGERAMKVSGQGDPTRWTVSIGMPFKAVACLDGFIDVYRSLFAKGVAIRHTGSAALDIAYTAAGIFDGALELAMAPWDVAAGVLLVEEAGGKSRFLEDSPLLPSCSVVAGGEPFCAHLEDEACIAAVSACLKGVHS